MEQRLVSFQLQERSMFRVEFLQSSAKKIWKQQEALFPEGGLIPLRGSILLGKMGQSLALLLFN